MQFILIRHGKFDILLSQPYLWNENTYVGGGGNIYFHLWLFSYHISYREFVYCIADLSLFR